MAKEGAKIVTTMTMQIKQVHYFLMALLVVYVFFLSHSVVKGKDIQQTEKKQIEEVSNKSHPKDVFAAELPRLRNYSRLLSGFIDITQKNGNLSASQKLLFVSKLKDLHKQIDNAQNRQEIMNAQNKVTEIEFQILLIQAQKACGPGGSLYLGNVRQNLEAAKFTLKRILNDIQNDVSIDEFRRQELTDSLKSIEKELSRIGLSIAVINEFMRVVTAVAIISGAVVLWRLVIIALKSLRF